MPPWIYVHNLSPFIFQLHIAGQTIGPRWYGLAYAVGLLSAFWAFGYAARRGYLPGFDIEARSQMMIAVTVGVLGGGRLAFVLQHLSEWLRDPLFAFLIWEGGMTFFGGLLGVIIALAWTARRYRLSFWALTDVAAFPAAFGLGVGRIANFINGELFGRPTHSDWGVIFPRADNLPRHPSQLYEAASHFLLLGVLLWLLHRRPQPEQQRPGVFSAWFLALYGALRFLTDFYRADDTFFGPFSSGQWASLVVCAVGIALLLRFKSAHVAMTKQENHTSAVRL